MSMSRVSRSPPFLEIPAQRHEGCLAHRVELGVDGAEHIRTHVAATVRLHEGCLAHRVELGVDGAEHIRTHVAATVRLLDRGLSRDFSKSQKVPRQAKKALSPKP